MEALTWEELLVVLEGSRAEIRPLGGAQSDVTLNGSLQVGEGYLLFRPDARFYLPDVCLAGLTVWSLRGVLRGTGVLFPTSDYRCKVQVMGPVRLAQRRDHFRFQVDHPVALEPVVGAPEQPAVLVDFSLTGGRIRTQDNRTAGELLQIKIGDGPGGPIQLMGQVQWVRVEVPGSREAGLRWIRMTPESEDQLRTLILAMVAGDWPPEG